MKCAVCGYKHNEYDLETDHVISDDISEFIRIEGNFTTKKGFYRDIIEEVSIHACPKCGTVRIGD